MMRLFNKNAQAGGEATGGHRVTPGELRIRKDLSELSLAPNVRVTFPDGRDKPMKFLVSVAPEDGYYRGGTFQFTFVIPPGYPHDAPKVHCDTPIYHPNINWEGAVCLNILRADWKPILNINAVIYGLQFLFYEPNPHDPLNDDAAQMLKTNKPQFERNVQTSLRGGNVCGHVFPRNSTYTS
eukprot:gnl/Hemi2/17841_TR5885_c0_g1_i1.p2 gnl/Hemi2/17841_TR5885_c0_g1~~gnl/Hemi2/17841_TR5885_c0_g1_i1.p2  ORF type:complete len:182 (-),score=67.75 gnl/Hemi2/17841_TR5885_c0_g1_i1:303-848(-)